MGGSLNGKRRGTADTPCARPYGGEPYDKATSRMTKPDSTTEDGAPSRRATALSTTTTISRATSARMPAAVGPRSRRIAASGPFSTARVSALWNTRGAGGGSRDRARASRHVSVVRGLVVVRVARDLEDLVVRGFAEADRSHSIHGVVRRYGPRHRLRRGRGRGSHHVTCCPIRCPTRPSTRWLGPRFRSTTP